VEEGTGRVQTSNSSISNVIPTTGMRDKIGGRPYEVRKDGSRYVISFYPMSESAKNPDAVLFRLTLTRDELKKISKIAA